MSDAPAAPAGFAAAPLADLVGDSAAPATLERLERAGRDAPQDARIRRVLPEIEAALAAANARDYAEGSRHAMRALERDAEVGVAWRILGICREKLGDMPWAVRCYEAALELTPDDVSLVGDLARLAQRLEMIPVAEELYRAGLAYDPDNQELVNNLACLQRDAMRHDDAVETLRSFLHRHPDSTLCWNALASVMIDQGEMPLAVTFLTEALRLDPNLPRARHNRANALCATGEPTVALADLDVALSQPALASEHALSRLCRSFCLLETGRLGEAWAAYEARRDPDYGEFVAIETSLPLWTPETSLAGLRLLVVGEQGLGDELMFANMLADVVAELGAPERLTVAVEPRLESLFRRSLPGSRVTPARTYTEAGLMRRSAPEADPAEFDLWTPMASLTRRFRTTLDSFPTAPGYMRPDPARVAHWRETLAVQGAGRKVGLLWKSMKMNSARMRFYPPLQAWTPLLQVPGTTFVNLQYCDWEADVAWMRSQGAEVWTPEGIDLKDDLDEVAALVCALDRVVAPSTATTCIAGACGAPLWMITHPADWRMLGSGRYPWYPQARVFQAPAFNDWAPALDAAAAALRVLA